MSGNTFGKLFTVTSFGESHGKAIGCIIDGCPPGLTLNESLIQPYLDKRKPGQSRYTSQRREDDRVEILSGVFENKTTGTPISLIIHNTDQRTRDYEAIKNIYRPGHADITYDKKYGFRDYRGGGRSSARETAARVAAGAVASIYLKDVLGIEIVGYLQQIGTLAISFKEESEISANPFFCPSKEDVPKIETYIESIRKEGDSVGARVGIIARGMPFGLGEPVFDKLDASIAFAMMSINAVKGVEVGAGFGCVSQKGSEHRDEMTSEGFLSNQAGGVLGGISSGQHLSVSIALKPTSSITIPGQSIHKDGTPATVVTKGRHDPCVGFRAVPIAQAMLALVIMDHYLRNKAQNLNLRVL